MTRNDVAKLKVGSVIVDCLGAEKEVVSEEENREAKSSHSA